MALPALSSDTASADLSSEAADGPVSLERFLAHLDEDAWTEWVEGEVLSLSPASTRHQDLVGFLLAVLLMVSEDQDAGEVLSAPFLMVLRDQDRAREPDLLFVRREHRDRIRESHLEGPADLVFEIVSPDSVSRDRGEKFVEYEAAGISEYWLVDPQREQAELYRLESASGKEDPARYRPVSPDADGAYRSEVLEGLKLRPEWLWQDPLPKVLDVARELGLLDGSVS